MFNFLGKYKMIKTALCINSYEELTKLVNREVDTIEAKIVSRDICEKVENNLQQLIPYVVFYNIDIHAGKLKFIQYLRCSSGKGEQRLQGNTSIGFGGHIDQKPDIIAREIITNENELDSYKMSLSDIVETAIKAGLREVQEELSINLLNDIGDVIDRDHIVFFQGDMNIEVNRVHTGIGIPVKLTEEQFNKLKNTCKFNEAEIEKLDVLSINIDLIVEQMDTTLVLNEISNELINKYNLEQWSTVMFNYITRKELNEMMKEISYSDIVALICNKKAALEQTTTKSTE